MSTLNIANLVRLTSVVDTGARLIDTSIRVSQDPPVRKAATQFRDDVVQSARSGANLVSEARESWHRHTEA